MAKTRLSPYAAPSATREVLERHGLYTKYALGQNFLVNDDVVRKIIELADVRLDDHILEVGPGIGTLTAALLQRANRVTAIEMDRDLPAVLADTLSPWSDRFVLIASDALDVTREALEEAAAGLSDLGEMMSKSNSVILRAKPEESPQAGALGIPRSLRRFARNDGLGRIDHNFLRDCPNKLVSNLPYSVAATIVLDYMRRFDFLQSAVVMVQREVADRMAARPGTKAYGAYTVKLSMFSQVAGRFAVAPGNFFPPPHVESSVVRLDHRTVTDDSGRTLASEELDAICEMADAAFATRRKTIANSCKTYFAGRPHVQAMVPDLLARTGIDSRRRGETLDQVEFIRLGLAYNAMSKDASLVVRSGVSEGTVP